MQDGAQNRIARAWAAPNDAVDLSLIERRPLSDLGGSGEVWRHSRSGLPVCIVDNDDPHGWIGIDASMPTSLEIGAMHALGRLWDSTGLGSLGVEHGSGAPIVWLSSKIPSVLAQGLNALIPMLVAGTRKGGGPRGHGNELPSGDEQPAGVLEAIVSALLPRAGLVASGGSCGIGGVLVYGRGLRESSLSALQAGFSGITDRRPEPHQQPCVPGALALEATLQERGKGQACLTLSWTLNDALDGPDRLAFQALLAVLLGHSDAPAMKELTGRGLASRVVEVRTDQAGGRFFCTVWLLRADSLSTGALAHLAVELLRQAPIGETQAAECAAVLGQLVKAHDELSQRRMPAAQPHLKAALRQMRGGLCPLGRLERRTELARAQARCGTAGYLRDLLSRGLRGADTISIGSLLPASSDQTHQESAESPAVPSPAPPRESIAFRVSASDVPRHNFDPRVERGPQNAADMIRCVCHDDGTVHVSLAFKAPPLAPRLRALLPLLPVVLRSADSAVATAAERDVRVSMFTRGVASKLSWIAEAGTMRGFSAVSLYARFGAGEAPAAADIFSEMLLAPKVIDPLDLLALLRHERQKLTSDPFLASQRWCELRACATLHEAAQELELAVGLPRISQLGELEQRLISEPDKVIEDLLLLHGAVFKAAGATCLVSAGERQLAAAGESMRELLHQLPRHAPADGLFSDVPAWNGRPAVRQHLELPAYVACRAARLGSRDGLASAQGAVGKELLKSVLREASAVATADVGFSAAQGVLCASVLSLGAAVSPRVLLKEAQIRLLRVDQAQVDDAVVTVLARRMRSCCNESDHRTVLERALSGDALADLSAVEDALRSITRCEMAPVAEAMLAEESTSGTSVFAAPPGA